jgi:hypothetical protein
MSLTMDEVLDLPLRDILEMAESSNPVLVQVANELGDVACIFVVKGEGPCERLHALSEMMFPTAAAKEKLS